LLQKKKIRVEKKIRSNQTLSLPEVLDFSIYFIVDIFEVFLAF